MDACTTAAPRVCRGDLAMVPPAELATVTAIAHALSDPARVQMVRLLEQREELCTCEFEELLALGQSRVSYHLKLLLDAGLLVRRRHGTWNHYRLARRDLLACLYALASRVDEMTVGQMKKETEKETQGGNHTTLTTYR